MGLWGLFTAAVGLGVIAKDAIDVKIEDTKRYNEATRNQNPIYYVYGKTYSTATGERCSIDTDYDTMHNWVVDMKTGRKIQDYTEYLNYIATQKNRQKAHAEGKKFYRTAEFDCNPRWWSDVYVNDDMPGRYFRRDLYREYQEGELIEDRYGGKYNHKMKVETDFYNKVRYNEKGELIR